MNIGPVVAKTSIHILIEKDADGTERNYYYNEVSLQKALIYSIAGSPYGEHKWKCGSDTASGLKNSGPLKKVVFNGQFRWGNNLNSKKVQHLQALKADLRSRLRSKPDDDITAFVWCQILDLPSHTAHFNSVMDAINAT